MGRNKANSTKVKELKESLAYLDIKNDLLSQLETNGTKGRYYIDLIDDYMHLWITKTLLIEDIESRGVVVKYDNGGGQKGKKKNDSIQELNKVNTQMLHILNELGLKPTDTTGDGDEL